MVCSWCLAVIFLPVISLSVVNLGVPGNFQSQSFEWQAFLSGVVKSHAAEGSELPLCPVYPCYVHYPPISHLIDALVVRLPR